MVTILLPAIKPRDGGMGGVEESKWKKMGGKQEVRRDEEWRKSPRLLKKKTETKRERKLKEKKTDKRWKLKNSRMW